jgi:hypothetical protein
MPYTVPERAWQRVGADLFQFKGRDYLLVVDYYSKYPEIALLSSKTASDVIIHLKSIFSRHGIPEELIADFMPFGSAEMRRFAESWNFVVTNSSPHFPSSNGQAESMVKCIKNLLKKADIAGSDPYIALMQYRNTPLAVLNLSPAQLLMNRALRTKLPVTSTSLQPKVAGEARERLQLRQNRMKTAYDRHAKPLPMLGRGDVVRLQHNGRLQQAVVQSLHDTPRSFVVKTEEGGMLRRNRRHLIKSQESPPDCNPPLDDIPSAPDLPAVLDSPDVVASSSASSNANSVPPAGILKTSRSGRVVKPPVRFRDFVAF